MAKETKSYAQKAVQARTGRDPEELLRELYVEQRRSQEEIATALGVARTTITAWLAEYGISRDDRDALPPLVDVA